MIMNRLKKLDKVAYVRFASVYMDFRTCRNSWELRTCSKIARKK